MSLYAAFMAPIISVNPDLNINIDAILDS